MQQLFMVLFLAGTTGAFAQPVVPAQTMFDKAVRDEAGGKFDRARQELVTLEDTYSGSPLALRARTEVFALDLFLEAREKQQTGHSKAAFITYRTVAQVYPESPLAQQAESSSRALDAQSKAPVVRSLAYRGFPVTQNTIVNRFAEREVPLAVERPYDPDEMERARKVLVQLLIDNGHGDLDVRAEAENIPPHAIGITFTAAKK